MCAAAPLRGRCQVSLFSPIEWAGGHQWSIMTLETGDHRDWQAKG